MKKTISLLFVMVFTFAFALHSSAQNTDLNGSWKIDRTKSVVVEYLPVLARIDVQIKGDSLLTQRYYEANDGQQYPFTENVLINGQDCNIVIYDMPRKTKASWSDQDGSLIIESTTTFNGQNGPENFISKETWKADPANKAMTMSYKNSIAGNELSGTILFNKTE